MTTFNAPIHSVWCTCHLCSDWVKRQAESKLNRELQQLRNDMDKSRCAECGFTGYEHQDWCPKRKS